MTYTVQTTTTDGATYRYSIIDEQGKIVRRNFKSYGSAKRAADAMNPRTRSKQAQIADLPLPQQPVIEKMQEASTVEQVEAQNMFLNLVNSTENKKMNSEEANAYFLTIAKQEDTRKASEQEPVATVEASLCAQPSAEQVEPPSILTPSSIEAYAEQCHSARQEALSKRLASLKARVHQEGYTWENIIFHAVPSYCRDGAYSDESIQSHQLDYIAKYLGLPRCTCGKHTSKQCPRCQKPCCSYCEWGTLDHRLNACRECAIVIRKEQEANQKAELEAAWLSLQSVPSYFERDMPKEEEMIA